jgi:uncharacterized protein YPO0396
MPCNGESALLTGDNGSGKTTLVDALVSLLVPSVVRFYNRSSGTNQRRERTEESYILGACNTKREEGNYTAQAEYLRTKQETLSCLLGIFSNSGTGAAVTLFQVRYFSAEGKLQQVYAIAQRDIQLKNIYDALTERNILFDRQGKWKKFLQESFACTFFGDSFKKYSARFSQLFGFRSDKALNLFSETVGVKELENLNEFIRTKMFEQLNMEDEFSALHANYSNLLNSYNEIEKTQEQLRLLQPILESGRKLDAEKQREAEYREYISTAALWFSRTAIALTEEALTAETVQRNIDEAKQRELDIRIAGLEIDIEELNTSLAQNEMQQRIRHLDDRIAQVEKERNLVQANRTEYQRHAAAAGCPVPDTAARFEQNRQTVEAIAEKCRHTIGELRESWAAAAGERNILSSRMQDVREELASLAGRSSNIPGENIRIRERICRGVGCSEADIPFAGELLQVAPEQEYWSGALEKLLRHFGLSLIVPEGGSKDLYKKVNAFVHGNNLKGRVVYFKADDRESFFVRDRVPGSAVSKLLVKQEHPLASWIEGYIAERFDYLCTDDMKEFAAAERAITSTGLIKAKNRHEKDDREHSGVSSRILGWDNQAKRQELSEHLDTITAQRETVEAGLFRVKEDEQGERDKLSACERLLEFGSWEELDLKTLAASIDSYSRDRDALLNSAGELKLLNSQLETRRKELREARSERDEVLQIRASRNDRIRKLEEKLSGYRQTAAVFDAIPDRDEKIAAFLAALELDQPPNDVRQLEAMHESIRERIRREQDRCKNSIISHTTILQRAMTAFLRPVDTYPSWKADVLNLNDSIDCIDDYRRMAQKLERDDLPRYKREFRKYLNEQLSEGVINFHQTLENWEQKIKTGISELNSSLRQIPYNTDPSTYLALEHRPSIDQRIKAFAALKHAAIPDIGLRYLQGSASEDSYESEEAEFLKVQELIGFLKDDDTRRKLVLDVRNWFDFSAIEYFAEDNREKQFYQNSASLSGGEKAKLAYTILASAIAFQFGINDTANSDNSFRFVIIDEAFSKIDPRNSRYAMELFKLLDLQLLVVTPMDKINVVEEYVRSVHITENHGTQDSRLISMTLQEYNRQKDEYTAQEDAEHENAEHENAQS